MWQYNGRSFNLFDGSPFGIGIGLMFAFFILWSLIWKVLALWKAAQNKDVWWFIAIFFLNTVGILEILYLYVFSKRKKI